MLAIYWKSVSQTACLVSHLRHNVHAGVTIEDIDLTYLYHHPTTGTWKWAQFCHTPALHLEISPRDAISPPPKTHYCFLRGETEIAKPQTNQHSTKSHAKGPAKI